MVIDREMCLSPLAGCPLCVVQWFAEVVSVVMDQSVGSAQQRILEPTECIALLASQKVGRVVSAGPTPEIRPVNFVLVGPDIFVRSDRRLDSSQQIVFEVDHFDADDRDGWSVIVEGHAVAVLDAAVIGQIVERLTPWAPGTKSRVSQIVIDSVSGRWIRATRQSEPVDERGYL